MPFLPSTKAAREFRIQMIATLDKLHQTVSENRSDLCNELVDLRETLKDHRAEAAKGLTELKADVASIRADAQATERWKHKLIGIALGIGGLATVLAVLLAFLQWLWPIKP